jgi:hypothetical protein
VVDEDLTSGQVAREIGLDLLAPAARTAEANRSVPDHVRRTLLASGFTALGTRDPSMPAGMSATNQTAVIVAENLAYGDPGLALAGLWSQSFAAIVSHHAYSGIASSTTATALGRRRGRVDQAGSRFATILADAPSASYFDLKSIGRDEAPDRL